MPRKPKPAPAKKPAPKAPVKPPAKKAAAKSEPKAKAKPKRKAAPKKVPALEPLTYRQRLFVGYYAGEAKGNGSEAARLAGYGSPRVEASRLLTKANIQAAIAAKTATVALTQDEVLARLSDLASADIGPALKVNRAGDPSVDLRVLKKLGLTHLIKEIRPTLHGVTIRFHDPVKTLELLGRYHGLFSDGAKEEQPAASKPRLTIPDRDDRT